MFNDTNYWENLSEILIIFSNRMISIEGNQQKNNDSRKKKHWNLCLSGFFFFLWFLLHSNSKFIGFWLRLMHIMIIIGKKKLKKIRTIDVVAIATSTVKLHFKRSREFNFWHPWRGGEEENETLVCIILSPYTLGGYLIIYLH